MITKWNVFNFKSIREETELELSPLTIFAGANSSGKSTFIQSVLLVAQTLGYKVGSRSVVLNGALASLGQFDDLKSNVGVSDQITIKCTCRPRQDLGTVPSTRPQFASRSAIYFGPRSNRFQEIVCEISFGADSSNSDGDLFQIQPQLLATQLSCVSRDEDNLDQKANISIRHSTQAISQIERFDHDVEIDDQLRASLTYAVELDGDSMSEVRRDYRSAKPIGCILHHFLPERVVYAINTMEEDANDIAYALQDDGYRALYRPRIRRREIFLSEEIVGLLREILEGTIDFDHTFKDNTRKGALSNTKTMTFRNWFKWLHSLPHDENLKVQHALRDCDDLFERILTAMKASASENVEKYTFVQAIPPRLISEATKYLDNFFAISLKYLGPLRDAPKPLYPLAPASDPHDVGLRGEHTASILELHKNKKVRYIPSVNFKNPLVERKEITRTLEAAVIDWLQYLGVAHSVESRDQGKLGHELKVGLSNSESMHDLTHVGVGVSQILPILVMCLLADTDSTLVFEQPELHLHPTVQSLLGDFFLSMALCNKQCIVETHSEYFIDRLRFRMAAASSKKGLNTETKIYFVEKRSQTSSFREVLINEYGAISDWPEGFFDQSQKQAEEILRAAALKRKASRNEEGGQLT